MTRTPENPAAGESTGAGCGQDPASSALAPVAPRGVARTVPGEAASPAPPKGEAAGKTSRSADPDVRPTGMAPPGNLLRGGHPATPGRGQGDAVRQALPRPVARPTLPRSSQQDERGRA